ncbi:MAG: histidine phosphatase family protein [Oscillibacter sp.]|nr:histidine phosphatase family protein [Oscillibacter sp.]
MKLYLLRHGETSWNVQGRYQGVSDIPLSPEGMAALRPADFAVGTVIVSPLARARQTAQILFPKAAQEVEPGLQEMNFGRFEGRTAQEMEEDAAYRAWVDSGCMGPVPGGESMAEFSGRVCSAFSRVLDKALSQGPDPLAIVAHGGTLMAVMERYAAPRRGYFAWQAPNGGGWLLEAEPGPCLRVLHPVCCAKDGAPC